MRPNLDPTRFDIASKRLHSAQQHAEHPYIQLPTRTGCRCLLQLERLNLAPAKPKPVKLHKVWAIGILTTQEIEKIYEDKWEKPFDNKKIQRSIILGVVDVLLVLLPMPCL